MTGDDGADGPDGPNGLEDVLGLALDGGARW